MRGIDYWTLLGRGHRVYRMRGIDIAASDSSMWIKFTRMGGSLRLNIVPYVPFTPHARIDLPWLSCLTPSWFTRMRGDRLHHTASGGRLQSLPRMRGSGRMCLALGYARFTRARDRPSEDTGSGTGRLPMRII